MEISARQSYVQPVNATTVLTGVVVAGVTAVGPTVAGEGVEAVHPGATKFKL